MALLPSRYRLAPKEVEQHFGLVEALCSFAYACGQEAAREGLPRVAFAGAEVEEPQTILAWEAGWDAWNEGGVN